MKKILMGAAMALMLSLGLANVFVPATTEYVAAEGEEGGSNATTGSQSAKDYVGKTGGNEANSNNLMGVVRTIINVVLGIVGIIAVVMVIIGGITISTSQGDAGKVTKGKNTLLYGIIGLVIALLAFAIVNFVLSAVF